MVPEKYDFAGWATRNDLLCSDGRTIRHNAFKDCDGLDVPLVWNHGHSSPDDVLGHGMLENRDGGVYFYGSFNDTTNGRVAKTLVDHGDITHLSIYANQLKQINKDVVHGMIREVSLVHCGANPGAYIETVIAHSADADEEAIIYSGVPMDFEIVEHAGIKKEEDEQVAEEKKVEETKEEKEPKEEKERTIGDVLDEMTEEQRAVVEYLLEQAAGKEEKPAEDGEKKAEKKEDSVEHSDNNEEETLMHNVFEAQTTENNEQLMHGLDAIIKDGKRFGSMKESYLQHAAEYGIEQIDWLFPEAKNINGDGAPGFINNTPDEWVQIVLKGVKRTPFSRIKMMYADITEDEARAKGYIKGKLKKEEVFTLLKRSVGPTTIYKKQKMDRDDVTDIIDFDVISWIKGEMRIKLDEEIARAVLFGDGRSSSDDDKINESCIIPIAKENAFYCLTATTTYRKPSSANSDDTDANWKKFIKDLRKQILIKMEDYEGSGNTICFIPQRYITQALLVEDAYDKPLYANEAAFAAACGVGRFVKVPDAIVPSGYAGVIVDLKDYTIGADKGGAINMFDDFDIDYNQQKYLMETRCSGCLVKPNSAIAIALGTGTYSA